MPDDPIAPEPPTLDIALDVARAARSDGDLIGALAIYSTLRETYPGELAPYREAAQALIETGHHEEAEILLEVAAECVALDAGMHAVQASLAERRRDWPAAVARWDRARSETPGVFEYWLNAARCQREAGLMADAEALLRQAAERFPNRIEPIRELAWLITHIRRFDEAAALWQQIRDTFPDHPVGFVGGSSVLRTTQRLAEAAVLLAKALQRFPADFDLLSERAWLAFDLAEYEDCVTRFAALRVGFPDHALPPLGLGRALAALGRFDQAEAAYSEGQQAFPHFDLLHREREALSAQRAAWVAPVSKPAIVRPETGVVHIAVTGFHLAYQLSLIFARMLPFRGRVAVRWLNAGMEHTAIQAQLPAGWLDGTSVYFEESQAGGGITRRGLRALLPGDCDIRTFPTSSIQALWPFQGKDERLVPEPPLYNGGRYMYTDRIAAALANPSLTDDALFDLYMELTEAEPLDLDALYAADVARWEAEDTGRDVHLAPFLQAHFRDTMLFAGPQERCAPIVTEVARQLLATPALRQICDLETAVGGLDRLTHGWRAEDRALPVHPRVARHFGLAWWSPDQEHLLGHSRYGFRDYILRYLRWSPYLI